MSPKPTTTSGQASTNYYPTQQGTRYGVPQFAPPPHPSFSRPAISRPHLPPPSHLEPSFVPQSPQGRPQYSDLPPRAAYPPYPRQPGYDATSSADYRTGVQSPAFLERSSYTTGSHPPLYPQRVSYQSTNPGTLYEALSPIDYSTHGPPPEPSMFNEMGYLSTSPYPMASLPQFHQSPVSSYHSSATSSSGLSVAQIPFSRPDPGRQSSLQTQTV